MRELLLSACLIPAPATGSLEAFIQPHTNPWKWGKIMVAIIGILGLPWWSTGYDCLPMQGLQGSIPSQGAKMPHASWPKHKNIKQKQYCNKFNKDLKKKEAVL